jgi:hypothetical protein
VNSGVRRTLYSQLLATEEETTKKESVFHSSENGYITPTLLLPSGFFPAKRIAHFVKNAGNGKP